MLNILQIGDWMEGDVRVTWTASTRRIVDEVEKRIEQAWAQGAKRPGMHLFDGPMCRLERFEASSGWLELWLSPTSYKPFFGTNLVHPEFADRFGRDVMANPIGVSPALLSCDNFILLGRRNQSVAYYPGRIHPFSGALEPQNMIDVFANVRRELHEELNLADTEVREIHCLGIVEDRSIRHPELIFAAKSTLTRDQIETRLDQGEHSAVRAVPAEAPALEQATHDSEFTPVALATLLLWASERSARHGSPGRPCASLADVLKPVHAVDQYLHCRHSGLGGYFNGK